MRDTIYYRQQASRAKWLGGSARDPELGRVLRLLARDLDELAEELEKGRIEIKRPAPRER
jgi:hypothetical protein